MILSNPKKLGTIETFWQELQTLFSKDKIRDTAQPHPSKHKYFY